MTEGSWNFVPLWYLVAAKAIMNLTSHLTNASICVGIMYWETFSYYKMTMVWPTDIQTSTVYLDGVSKPSYIVTNIIHLIVKIKSIYCKKFLLKNNYYRNSLICTQS